MPSSKSMNIADDTSITRDQRRAIVAALFGNVLEWFDFTVFGLVAAALAANFFSTGAGRTSSASLLLAFATFGVGFVARPVGGMVMGLFGDRYGRKRTLIFTILGMALATGLMGLLPSAERIGVAAPILLVALRLIQGFAAGGEWSGAATFLVEWAPGHRRGFFGAIHPAAVFVGVVLGSLCTALVTSAVGQNGMNDWGWRIPFLVGGVIGLIALPFRFKVAESPVFRAAVEPAPQTSHLADTSTVALDRRQLSRSMLLTFCLSAMPSAAVYTFITYLPTFVKTYTSTGKSLIGFSSALWSTTLASMVVIVVALLAGALSDRIGRKTVLLASCLAVLILTLPLFVLLLNSKTLIAVIVIQVILAASVALFLGPMEAVFIEAFRTRVRLTGIGTAYNLGSAVFGGFAPFIAVALIQRTDLPWTGSLWVIITAIISCVAVIAYKESLGKSITN